MGLGIPAEPGISKLNIGWAAKEFNFKNGINDFIKKNLKSGDEVSIKLTTNGFFDFYELKDSNGTIIGQLSKPQGKPSDEKYKKQEALRKDGLKKFVINEIVVWSYEDTISYDKKKPENFDNWPMDKKVGKPDKDGFYSDYHKNWCQEARNQDYIYLVDFAGFGVPSDC